MEINFSTTKQWTKLQGVNWTKKKKKKRVKEQGERKKRTIWNNSFAWSVANFFFACMYLILQLVCRLSSAPLHWISFGVRVNVKEATFLTFNLEHNYKHFTLTPIFVQNAFPQERKLLCETKSVCWHFWLTFFTQWL